MSIENDCDKAGKAYVFTSTRSGNKINQWREEKTNAFE